MNVKFDPLIVSLFTILKKNNSFSDILYDYYQDPNLDDYFKFYENELFGSDKNSTEKKVKYSIINACLYIENTIIPLLIKEDNFEILYIDVKSKIGKFKIKWQQQIKTLISKGNTTKYILAEMEQLINEKGIEFTESKRQDFIKSRLEKIDEWVKDETYLLSDFYYVDALQKNQIDLVLKDEPIYIILQDIYENNNSSGILDIINNIKNKHKHKEKSANLPNSIIGHDGLFLASKKTLENVNYVKTDTGVIVSTNPKSLDHKVAIPQSLIDAGFSLNNSDKDFVNLNCLFIVGDEELSKGNGKISFTMREICELKNIEPCSTNYEEIEKTLTVLQQKVCSIKISDTYTRQYNIVTTIDTPIRNSNKELEWRITFHEEIVQEYVARNYQKVLLEKLNSFRYGLSVVLIRMFLYDFTKLFDVNKTQHNSIKYDWSDIASRTGLTGKPNKIKTKIINSLDEIVDIYNSFIYQYETSCNNSTFEVFAHRDNLRLTGDV